MNIVFKLSILLGQHSFRNKLTLKPCKLLLYTILFVQNMYESKSSSSGALMFLSVFPLADGLLRTGRHSLAKD